MSNRNLKGHENICSSHFSFVGRTKPISELMFNKYDKDKNGFISRDELRSLCYDLGYYLSDAELSWAWTIIDKDGSGMIDYKEFSQWWKTSSRFEHLKIPNEKQVDILYRIIQICRSYDQFNLGTLDKIQFNNVREILIKENIININQYQACHFDEIDRSHDGKINFNELIAWLKDIAIINTENS